jgi:hypothetical protein
LRRRETAKAMQTMPCVGITLRGPPHAAPSRDASLARKGISLSRQSMIRKSAKRFSEKIMLKQ